MCKHVAAVLYGVGARLDHAPEMLFALRGVDPAEMVADAVGQAPTKRKTGRGRVLAADDLSSVFGVDIDLGDVEAEGEPRPARRRRKTAAKQGSGEKVSRRKISGKKGSRKKVATRSKAAETRAKKKATKNKGAKKKAGKKRASRKRPAKRKATP
jgi:uncharacterized Zn finger protein